SVCGFLGNRIQTVGEILKGTREAEIGTAPPKHQRESKAPEADHAVQMPGHALPPHAAVERKAATPRLDSRPPDHEPGGSEQDHDECTNTIYLPTRFAGEQIVVQIEQPRHGAHPDWDR